MIEEGYVHFVVGYTSSLQEPLRRRRAMAAGQLCQISRPVLLLSLPGALPLAPSVCVARSSRGRFPKRLCLVSAEGNRDRNDRDKRQQNNATSFVSSLSFKTLAGQVLIVIGTLGFLDAG